MQETSRRSVRRRTIAAIAAGAVALAGIIAVSAPTNLAHARATADAADPQSKMPDIGVIGQRYRFELMGASQELKLYSWVSHERKFHTVPFEWKPGIWYTMKLTATTEKKDGEEVSVLRGKAWPRDSEEPKDWQIEWTDKPANTIGAPGLTGNAKDSEIFIDNIKVMKN